MHIGISLEQAAGMDDVSVARGQDRGPSFGDVLKKWGGGGSASANEAGGEGGDEEEDEEEEWQEGDVEANCITDASDGEIERRNANAKMEAQFKEEIEKENKAEKRKEEREERKRLIAAVSRHKNIHHNYSDMAMCFSCFAFLLFHWW
jgi:hypothetical protein